MEDKARHHYTNLTANDLTIWATCSVMWIDYTLGHFKPLDAIKYATLLMQSEQIMTILLSNIICSPKWCPGCNSNNRWAPFAHLAPFGIISYNLWNNQNFFIVRVITMRFDQVLEKRIINTFYYYYFVLYTQYSAGTSEYFRTLDLAKVAKST